MPNNQQRHKSRDISTALHKEFSAVLEEMYIRREMSSIEISDEILIRRIKTPYKVTGAPERYKHTAQIQNNAT